MDTTMTLLGQPESYWNRPWTGEEYNQFFAWFLERGATFFLCTSLLYILGAMLAVTILPRRIALIVLFGYTLGHYEGATSWMLGEFGFGMWLAVVYAVIIGCGLVALGVDVQHPTDTADKV